MAALTIEHSPHSVRETADRLAAAIEERGLRVFARVDHGGGARAVGLDLADEELLIFGDPRTGTLLMQSDPEVGYELPLHILVWDGAGQTRVGYRPAGDLPDRYRVGEVPEVLEGIDRGLEALVAAAVAP
jgi:beta-galactosidase